MPQTRSTESNDPSEAAGGAARLRAPELGEWIDALPLADAGETYQRVLGSLSKLNDNALPVPERFETLELFRKPVRYLSDALKHHFVGASFPLTRRAHGVAAQLYELHLEMAKGYQSISDELLDLNTLRQDFTMLATSLHRVLYYLGQRLLTAYQVYEPCGAGYWSRIHLIYDAAESKGVQASVVKDPYRRGKQETTVENQFKQILLLALANPYRYPQADMAGIHTLLEQWAPLCHFQPTDRFDELQHACLVDLASDEGPCYITYSSTPHATTCRLLETSGLIQSLQNSIAADVDERSNQVSATGTEQTSTRGKKLLRSLISAWGSTTKRRFSRMQSETKTSRICLGLSTVHRLIENLDSIPNVVGDTPSPPESTLVRRYGATGRVHKSNNDGPYECEVINESADGSLLRWHNANNGKIRVGELIAIRRTDESGELSGIAVIRWLKNTGKRTVEFGIQLLSPDAFPVTIRHYNSNDGQSGYDYLKGLFIPELMAARQPASLILPAFLYRADDLVSLMMDSQEHCLQLVKAVETTPGYSRFLFTSMAAQDRH